MQTYIAKTLFGLEEVLVEELKHLGAKNIETLNRAARFDADNKTLYKIHLWSALCVRIIQPFAGFEATNPEELYAEVMKIRWDESMDLKDTFKIDAVVFSEHFNHSMYAGLKVKDAICDYFRKVSGKRPDVNVHNPTYAFVVNIRGSEVEIALDATGEILSNRKYRFDGNVAPLNEVLAAGIIALSNWKPGMPFVDGMTGSATLVVEALFKATNTPPNLNRKHFAFMNWPDFDRKLWDEIVAEAKEMQNNDYPNIIGIERDGKAFNSAKENLVRAHFLPIHHLQQGDFFKYVPKEKEGVVIINPPYDVRLKEDDVLQLYQDIGDHLKQNFTGWTAWIISSNVEARKNIGLRTVQKIKVFNGKLECRLLEFDLH